MGGTSSVLSGSESQSGPPLLASLDDGDELDALEVVHDNKHATVEYVPFNNETFRMLGSLILFIASSPAMD